MKSIQLSAYGNPADVVSLVDVPEVGPPEPGEIIIDVEASPVEPTDLLMIEGSYGYLPSLPHILGVEGVGRVSAVGHGVTHLAEGDRTIIPPFTPAWVGQVKTKAAWLRPLPDGDNLLQLSMLGMNPLTAFLMVTEFVHLRPGDWLLQNGSNSSVGRAVIPIAKALGIRTVNVVRRSELIHELTSAGADVVLMDGPDLPRRVAEATGNAKIMLALDCVGNSATQDLLNFDRPARHCRRLQRDERQALHRFGTQAVVLWPIHQGILGIQLASRSGQPRQTHSHPLLATGSDGRLRRDLDTSGRCLRVRGSSRGPHCCGQLQRQSNPDGRDYLMPMLRSMALCLSWTANP